MFFLIQNFDFFFIQLLIFVIQFVDLLDRSENAYLNYIVRC